MAEYLRPEEFAELIRTTKKAIYQLVYKGECPAPYRLGKRLLFKKAEIDKWIAAKRLLPKYNKIDTVI